ncbi:DUF2341 domain-containing protein, partial [Spirochaetota bacterium]
MYIYYGTNDGDTNKANWSNVINMGLTGLGAFSTNVTNISPGTEYYYRCYASNAIFTTNWASVSTNFTTSNESVQSIILEITNPASASTITSATQSFSGWATNASGQITGIWFSTNGSAWGVVTNIFQGTINYTNWQTNVDVSIFDGEWHTFYVMASNDSSEVVTNSQSNYIDIPSPAYIASNATRGTLYTTVPDAITDLSNGDTLYFYTGTNTNSIELINKTNVSIISYPWLTNSDRTASIISGPGSGIGIYISNSSGNTFRGFMLSNWNTAVKIYGASRANVIADNILRDCTSVGLYLENSMSYNTNTNNTIDGIEHGVMISNSHHDYVARNIIRNCTKNGVFIISNSFSNTVILNTITNNTLAGIHVSGGSFSNDCTHNNIMYHDTNLLHSGAGDNLYLSNYFGYIQLSSVEGTIEGTNTNGFVPYRLGFIGITQGDTTPPGIPTGFSINELAGNIVIDWGDSSGSPSGYRIYRSAGTNTWTNFTSPYSNTTVSIFTDENVGPGINYYYFITSYDSEAYENESWFSESVEGSVSDWYDTDWANRKLLTLDTSLIFGTHDNFPWLVVISNDTHLSGSAQGSGDDILFTYDDGLTKIPHEIEYYSSGTLFAWVKIGILSASTNTNLYVYFGNLTTNDMSDQTNVWDPYFGGVWHLEETSGTHDDSTSNGNTGYITNYTGGVIQNTQGIVGVADYINCDISNYIDCGTDSSLNAGANDFTFSLWFSYTNTSVFDGRFGGNGDLSATGGKRYSLQVSKSGIGRIGFKIDDDTANQASLLSSSDKYTNGLWHHLAGVRDGINLRLYLNGTEANTPADCTLVGSIDDPAHFILGGMKNDDSSIPYSVNAPYNGFMDEVRFTKTARSSNWIKTEYSNIIKNTGAITPGTNESILPISVAITNPSSGTTIIKANQSFSGRGSTASGQITGIYFSTNGTVWGQANTGQGSTGYTNWLTNVNVSLFNGSWATFYVMASNDSSEVTTNNQSNYIDIVTPVYFHVATNGNDGWAGTNYNTAFRNLQRAIDSLTADHFTNGDMYIYLHEGTHTSNAIVSNSFATALNKLVICSYTNTKALYEYFIDNVSIIDVQEEYTVISNIIFSNDESSPSDAVTIAADNCIVIGIDSYFGFSGVQVVAGYKNALIENCYMFDAIQSGIILTKAFDCTVRSNIVTQNPHGIKLDGATNILITNNMIISNWANGINMIGLTFSNHIIGNNMWSNAWEGVRVNNTASDYHTIAFNYCWRNIQCGIKIYNRSFNTIYRNRVIENSQNGIQIYTAVSNNYVINNTIVGNSANGIFVQTDAGSGPNYFYNNIILSNSQWGYKLAFAENHNQYIDHNVFYGNTFGPTNDTNNIVFGPSNYISDPILDMTTYEIAQSISPAVDNGTNYSSEITPSWDGNDPDIGFKESPYSSASLTEGHFHVATNGDDAWPGDISSPFLTLQKAIDELTADHFTNGDMYIYLHGGKHTSNAIVSNSFASSGTNLVICSYTNTKALYEYFIDNVSIIDVQEEYTVISNIIFTNDDTSPGDAVTISADNCSVIDSESYYGYSLVQVMNGYTNALIEGCYAFDAAQAGMIFTGAIDCILNSNIIYQCPNGVKIDSGTNILITNNTIYSNWSRGVNLINNSYSNRIIGNNIYSNTDRGINVNTGPNCAYHTIAYNNIWRNGLNNTSGIQLVNGYWNTIYRNRIIENGDQGIKIGDSSETNYIINNTIVNNAQSGILISSAAATKAQYVYNNILLSNNQYGFEYLPLTGSVSHYVDYNVIYGNTLGPTNETNYIVFGPNNYLTDPFLNMTTYEISSASSIAVDHGTNYSSEITPSWDGNDPDIGWKESPYTNVGVTSGYFHVATDGNDDDDGSESTPFATLQNAIDSLTADHFTSGDMFIYIHEGTHTNAADLTNSYASVNTNLVITSWTNADVVISNASGDYALRIEKDFIVISNLIFSEGQGNAIIITNANNIILNDLQINNYSETGIFLGGLSTNNRIISCAIYSNNSNGIFFSGNVADNIISSNTIWGLNQNNGIYFDSGSHDNSIRLNTITNDDTTGIRLENTTNNTIELNNLYGQSMGISYASGSGNTFYSNYFGSINLTEVLATNTGLTQASVTPYRLGVIGITQGDVWPPDVPTNIQSQKTTSYAVITWDESGNNPNGYRVYRSADIDTWTNFTGYYTNISDGTVTVYTDNTIGVDTNYYYYITSYDSEPYENESWWSTSVEVHVLVPPEIYLSNYSANAYVTGNITLAGVVTNGSDLLSSIFYKTNNFGSLPIELLNNITTNWYTNIFDTTKLGDGTNTFTFYVTDVES